MELTEQEIKAIEKIKTDTERAYETDRQALEKLHIDRFNIQMHGVLVMLRQLHVVPDDYVLSDDLTRLIQPQENHK